MKAIESARAAVFKRASAMLSWRQKELEGAPAPALLGNNLETALAGYGLVVTPAQDLAFFARSSAWRCTTCGKVHRFAERVSVVFASPCACASIEFEPQHEAFASASAPALAPELTLPALLTQ